MPCGLSAHPSKPTPRCLIGKFRIGLKRIILDRPTASVDAGPELREGQTEGTVDIGGTGRKRAQLIVFTRSLPRSASADRIPSSASNCRNVAVRPATSPA